MYSQEDHSKRPNLRIQCRLEELLERERLQVTILAVIFNATDDKGTLGLI